MTMGQRILLRRRELGLTQENLAKRAGLSRNYVALIERGAANNVSFDVLCRLAAVLGVALDNLGGCPSRLPSTPILNVHNTQQLNEFRSRKLAESDLPPETIIGYLDRLVMHIRYVQEAGKKIGVLPELLEVHDQSKFSDAEFNGYAKHFCGEPGGAPDDFAKAWLHHIHHNPHHWQHWMFADGFSPKQSFVENGVLEMPQHYALEMIADWMGASRAYTGSLDMTSWLHENMPRIKLHSTTARYMRETLDSLGYADVVHMQRWGHESE